MKNSLDVLVLISYINLIIIVRLLYLLYHQKKGKK
jgi:hypothetical protein